MQYRMILEAWSKRENRFREGKSKPGAENRERCTVETTHPHTLEMLATASPPCASMLSSTSSRFRGFQKA